MIAVLSWWGIMEIIGLLALPLALRLFCHLPERGYAFARPLGLLLAGYLWWLGGSLGFLSSSRSAILFALLLVGTGSLWIWRRDGKDLWAFLRQNRRVILATEVVFALALFGWAVVRAYNPDIAATEKPMEIAFLNAILRGDSFPPHDPWLSGFAISYYHFGYLLVALLTKLTGIAPSVAFNLGVSLLFSLTLSGAFGLVYDLVATDKGKRARESLSAVFWALLGPLFVAVMGNLEGLLEVLHTRGLGSPRFWQWLDVNGLVEAPVNGRWVPTDMWWWWRASRVINDRDLQGVHQEVIDEFPQFSFLLGDMHPHVLALPYVLMALALAFNLLLGAETWGHKCGDETETRTESAAARVQAWSARAHALLSHYWREHAFDLGMLALCLGALGFLNTWDFPIHLVVVVFAFFVGRRQQGDSLWWLSVAAFALSVAIPAVLLYLPFYVGFQSQAGGVLPVLFNVTRVHQYLLMFGPFVFVILSLVLWRVVRMLRAMSAAERRGFGLDVGTMFLWLVLGPLLLMGTSVVLVMATATGRQFLQGVLADERVQALIGTTGVAGLLRQAVLLRLTSPLTFLLVAVLIALLWYLLQKSWVVEGRATGQNEPACSFSYLIAAVAFLLTLVVEFAYLRDLFMTRMNTVFKFYYQAWVMMAVAAAFGAYYMVGRGAPRASRGAALGRYVWATTLLGLVLAGMVYPVLAIPNKAGGFKGEATLDGMAFLETARPDDYAAMRWLQENVHGISYIVESSGGSYSDSAFISAFTGLPTVLGWDFHQYQWRGNTEESSKREPDIAQIYQSADSQQVLALLDKYDVDYVYVGPVEKRKYSMQPRAAERFERFLTKVYDEGAVQIYRR